jgi:hypothetical protein
MIELPICRWRAEPTLPGRHACVSPKRVNPARGVPDEGCQTCWCKDHAPPTRRVGNCLHLGSRVGLAECLPCASVATEPVRVPAHTCGLHGRCTIATQLPGIRCCQHCGDFAAAASPAAAGDVRHLMYFVCPLGPLWRWNVALLRQRISLFNGRRHVFVVEGPGLAPFELVQSELADCQITWFRAENNPVLKEFVGFPTLLRSLSSYDRECDVTFYGHAKGVSSGAWGSGVRDWAESMYCGLLDYWPAVKRELARACCVGLWRKRQGWFPVSPSTWHYAGSFRWVRNRDMYSRKWDDYIADWVCPEDHVGRVFRIEESACLYGDCGSAATQLYGLDTWQAWATRERLNWEDAHLADKLDPKLIALSENRTSPV